MRSVALVIVSGISAGLAMLAPTATAGGTEDVARAVLRDAAGERVGAVWMTREHGHLVVRVSVRGLPPGFHGFHVHAVGRCVPPFSSAGGHLNPTGAAHGGHAGDLPVLLVMQDGTGQARVGTDRLALPDLFDADGSAVIVHAAADNYANIPARYHSHATHEFGPDAETLKSGDSGDRIACGVVRGRAR